MSHIKNWYVKNQDAISWFLIGWLSMGMLDNLIRGNYIWAAISALIIWVNYKLIDVRLQ